jgi:hypothetical protein
MGYLAYYYFLRPCLVGYLLIAVYIAANLYRLVILVTFFIYIRAGSTIYRKRRELDDFSSTDRDLTYGGGDHLGTIKTTEVSVTTEILSPDAIHLQSMKRQAPDPSNPSSNGVYSVHITAQASSGDVGDEVTPIEQQQTRASVQVPSQQQQRSVGNPARRRNRELNNAAWQYTKCALLFFTAILITWVPSSSNRVYSVFHPQSSSQTLEFMSAFVLPLQGFWNALIYMVTSWSACKSLMSDLRTGRHPDVTELVGGMAPDVGANHLRTATNNHRHNLGQFRRSNKFETESMTELANESRPTSDDERRDHVRV